MFNEFLDNPLTLDLNTFLLLPVLVALEAVLSADNAIALAAIAQGLEDSKLQRQALNFGLVVAFVLRVGLILTATWVTQFWQFEVLGGGYLLWLVFQHFTSGEGNGKEHHGPRFTTLWQVVPVIALTDLAFSLDSVTAAIAVSKNTWVIITGVLIGIIALRFMAELFIRWLEEFVYLEDAAYVTVALVGLRLLIKVVQPDLVPPEWVMLILIALLFFWGFSHRTSKPSEDESSDSQS